MENRRPRSEVVAVTLHNTHNNQGEWIPTRYERWSWVRLNHGRNGTWAREARRHGGESMRGSYKAQIMDFRFKFDGRRPVSNKPEVEAVLVRHAYHRHQVLLDPEIHHDRVPCNCESRRRFVSTFDEFLSISCKFAFHRSSRVAVAFHWFANLVCGIVC